MTDRYFSISNTAPAPSDRFQQLDKYIDTALLGGGHKLREKNAHPPAQAEDKKKKTLKLDTNGYLSGLIKRLPFFHT